MLELYIANKNYSSWSLRAWLLLKQLEIPFRERQFMFGAPGTEAALQSATPSGTVPCLVDGDTVVWESLAIAEYLAEDHRAVWPDERRARAFARSAAAEMHAGFRELRNVCTMNCGLRVRLHAPSAALLKDFARIDRLWGEGLERFGGPFLAGPRFCAADAFFAPVAFRVQTYSIPLSERALAYAAMLRGLPAMQEWYAAGLRETVRDEAHEAEARAAGEWVADLRAV
jgi:glutathione S-transferase